MALNKQQELERIKYILEQIRNGKISHVDARSQLGRIQNLVEAGTLTWEDIDVDTDTIQKWLDAIKKREHEKAMEQHYNKKSKQPQ